MAPRMAILIAHKESAKGILYQRFFSALPRMPSVALNFITMHGRLPLFLALGSFGLLETSLSSREFAIQRTQLVLSSGPSFMKLAPLRWVQWTIHKKICIVCMAFGIRGKPHKALKIIEITWRPPPLEWIKVNTDGSSQGQPGPSACGGIFPNSRGFVLSCFSQPLDSGICFRGWVGNWNCFCKRLAPTPLTLSHLLILDLKKSPRITAIVGLLLLPWWIRCQLWLSIFFGRGIVLQMLYLEPFKKDHGGRQLWALSRVFLRMILWLDLLLDFVFSFASLVYFVFYFGYSFSCLGFFPFEFFEAPFFLYWLADLWPALKVLLNFLFMYSYGFYFIILDLLKKKHNKYKMT